MFDIYFYNKTHDGIRAILKYRPLYRFNEYPSIVLT